MCPWYSPRHREGRYALKLISSARGRYASAAELLLCSVNPTALGVGWSMPHDTTRTNQRGAYSTASPWNSADECVPHTGWDGTSGEIRRSNPVDKKSEYGAPAPPPGVAGLAGIHRRAKPTKPTRLQRWITRAHISRLPAPLHALFLHDPRFLVAVTSHSHLIHY